MIYIYVELRYQRQLARICPDVLDSFFSALLASVHKNGGSEVRVSGGHLYCLDDASVGCAFSSARVISCLNALLEENRFRLREYFILAESLPNAVSGDAFCERLENWASVITPDEAILLTASAAADLEAYITAEPLPDTPFVRYTGLLREEEKAESVPESAAISFNLYTDTASDPLFLFRNLVCTIPAPDTSRIFSDEEQRLFAETRFALDMFARFRFSPRHPEYRLAACREYLGLFFRALASRYGHPVEVHVYGKMAPDAFVTQNMDRLRDWCDFSDVMPPVFKTPDLDDLPPDLLELAYLVYKASLCLFMDEMPAFFLFLGKQSDFMVTLGQWMHSFGLLSAANDFRSFNPALTVELERRLGANRQLLDQRLGRFLWTLHETGALQPVYALYEVFTGLGFSVPDSFLVNSLYHSTDPGAELDRVRAAFQNPELAVSVENLELARKKYESGLFDEASSLAKTVLHVFQKENVLTGEYRALSLIAMLSLARNNGDDASVYLEYALENAERMHDPFSVLCTRFDMAMVYFIIGNYHFALCTLDAVEKIVGACYAKDWEVLLLFMKGRIAFELGNYRNAELLFQTAASLASVHQIAEAVSLCRVWYARALVHQHRFASAETILAGCLAFVPESWIFLIESALLSGHTDPALDFPESLSPLLSGGELWTSGKITWRSGFSVAEDRCYGTGAEKLVAVRLYEVFLLYYRCRFVEGTDIAANVNRIAFIARNALEIKDPYAYLYYYVCYDLGSKNGAVLPADTTACLSRGFKYMQKRANEIEENSIREQYMQNPTWNSRLYRTARENMLI